MAPPILAAAAASTPTTPVLLLVGGLVVLAAGLLLLTGSRPHPDLPAVVRRPSPPSPTDAVPTVEPCDWSAWVEADDGTRTLVRGAVGRPCCTYVLRVRDLDPVDEPVDDVAESLVWDGATSRVGPRAATTPLERDVVQRRSEVGVGTVEAGLTLERTTGPDVTTTTLRHADDHADDTSGAAAAAAELWQRHLDQLHEHGAHPVPSDGSRVAPVEVRRRVEAVLVVERGCATVPQPARAAVGCRSRVEATSAGAARPVGALLASWVEVGATTVVADRPAGEPAGIEAWHPTHAPPASGVTVVADPAAATSAAAWEAHRQVPIDPHRVAVVVGTSVRLELDGTTGSTGTADLHATCDAGAHVRLGPVAGDDERGCRRCVPEVELVVGRAPGPGVRSDAAGSTSGVAIRLDGHTTRLLAPIPGPGTRSWTVAPEEATEGTPQPATRAR